MKIEIVPVTGILSAYGGGRYRGRTRNERGGILDESLLIRADEARMQLSRGTLAALKVLDAEWQAAGGSPIRLSEGRRNIDRQADERARYDAWVRAGRPNPGTQSWRSTTMRTTYVAPAGRSHHNWGGAIDIDIDALSINGDDSDETLSAFWRFAERNGFDPVISRPHKAQSESWHFDHLGGLKTIGLGFARRGKKSIAYGEMAAAGCALAGLRTGRSGQVAYLQAALAISGFHVGRIDGVRGPATNEAIVVALGLSHIDASTTEVLSAMAGRELGHRQIEAL